MRALMCAVLVFAVGCGQSVGDSAKSESREKAKRVDEKKTVEPPADDTIYTFAAREDIVGAFKENVISADRKYKGKRFRFEEKVGKVGRTQGGEPTVGIETVYNPRGRVAPTIILFFPKDREYQLAELKEGDGFVIVGRVSGRVNDDTPRGIQGYEFHVEVRECELLESTRGGKPLAIPKK